MVDIITIAIAAVAAVASAASAILSYKQMKTSLKEENDRELSAKKERTIEAYTRFQIDVLDKLRMKKKKNVIEAVELKAVPEYRDFYDGYRALIAKCEHFAVGLFEEVYDFEMFDKLGGEHVMYLFEKVYPVIEEARKAPTDVLPYTEFERLYEKLISIHRKGE